MNRQAVKVAQRAHVKHYKGVPIVLSSPHKGVRVGHIVQVGMLQFHSEYKAKQFIRSLTK